MKNIKKTLLIVVAMMLASAISVVATFAYLYDGSEVVRNTFTIGKVELSLDEAKVNEYGELLDVDGNVWTEASGKDKAPRVIGNEYKLVPARTYVKDPIVRVSEDSEVCIIYVLVYIPSSLDVAMWNRDYITKQAEGNGWHQLSVDRVPTLDDGRYLLFGWLDAEPGDTLPLFNNIKISADATQEQLEKAEAEKMEITAYAIQSEGFETAMADDIWTDIIVPAFDPFVNHQ
jgi:predicted ribosomally synthesized peptide with SipW-like signal peptide